MRVSKRKLRKWRKEKPMKHRSYAEKRSRSNRLEDKEIKEATRNGKSNTFKNQL